MPLKLPPPRGGALRALLWIVSILVILVITGLFVYDRMLRSKYEPAISAFRKDVTEDVGFFCEHQALLAKDPWFHETRTEGDAGPLLNAWLPWESAKESPKDSPVAIPAPLPRKNSDFKDWLTSPIDVSTLDFEWMRKLHAYDRWDILQNTPQPTPERLNWANAPIPDFIPLMMWSKFRLLHGLRTGQPVEAARDVRHLAWLAYRTDTVLGGAIATSLLRFERQAYDSLSAAPPEWQPMSSEQLDRMHMVIMSGNRFSNIAAPAEVAKQARSCGIPAVSRCIALAEAGSMLKYIQPLAEEDYRAAYAAHAEDLAASQCATSLPKALWERGVTVEEERLAKSPEHPEWLNTLPGAYAGSHIAGILIAIGTPNPKALNEFRAKLDGGKAEKKPKP
jgi:hypothetical protein